MPLNKDQPQSTSLQKKALMLGLGMLARRWVKELRSSLCAGAVMSLVLITGPASIVFFLFALMESALCVVLLGQGALSAIGLIGKPALSSASVGPIVDFISGAPIILPLVSVAVIAIACAMFKKRPIEPAELGNNQRWILRITTPLMRPPALALMRAFNALGDVFERCFARAAQSEWETRKSAVCIVAWGLIVLLSCFFGLAVGALLALNIVGVIPVVARSMGALLLDPIQTMVHLKKRAGGAQNNALVDAISARSRRAKAWASKKAREIAQEGAGSEAFARAEKKELEKSAPGASSQPGSSAPRL